MALAWETKTAGPMAAAAVAGQAATLTASVVPALAAASTALTTAAALGTTVLDNVSGLASQTLATTATAAANLILDTLDWAPAHTCAVYPTAIDVQRAKLKERITYLEEQVEKMRAQRVSAPGNAGSQRYIGARATLAAALDESALDADEVLASVAPLGPSVRPNSLDESIMAASAVLSVLRLQDRRMANPSMPVTYPFSSWLNDLEESFGDTADRNRPIISETTLTGGVVLLVSANSIAAFAEAVQSLATVLRFPKMARAATAMYSAQTYKRPLPAVRSGVGKSPDWLHNFKLSRLFGLEADIADFRRKMNSLSYAAPSTQLTRYITMASAAITDATDMAQSLIAGVTAIASASVSVHALVIPPADGTTTISFPGGSTYTIPNGTYGTTGYMRALRNATNGPTGDYVAGVAFFTSFPLPGLTALIPGFDGVSPIDPQVLLRAVNEPAAATIISAITNGVNTITASTGTLRTALGV